MSNQENGFLDQVGRGLGGLFKFLIRLLFVLMLAVGLGAGIFYGISVGLPALDRAYVQPVRDNTSAIAALETLATQMSEQQATQAETLQNRITALEVANDNNQDTLATIESQLATLTPLIESQEELEARLDTLDEALETIDAALQASEETLSTELAGLAAEIDANEDAIAALSAGIESDPFPGEQINADLQLVKVMALLTRAQLYLLQDNGELADLDLNAARRLAASVLEDMEETDEPDHPVLARIDLALDNLTDRPDLALSDIQAAWDELLEVFEPAEPPVDDMDETSSP